MNTHGYEHSTPWKLALALLDHTRALTDAFDDDAFGLAGKMRSIAADLPLRAALCFEQLDYHQARAHAQATAEQTLRLLLHAQAAEHLGLVTHRQVNDLRRRLSAFDDALAELPDELFEDDGPTDLPDAA